MANANAEAAEAKYKCPQGHELSPIGLPFSGCTCSSCGSLLSRSRCSLCCGICKFVLCGIDCRGATPLGTDRSLPGAPRCRSCRAHLEWTDSNPDGWQCSNNCLGRQTNRGDWRWQCNACFKAVCQRCIEARLRVDPTSGHIDTPRTKKRGREFLNLCQDHQWEAVFERLAAQPGLVNYKADGRWSALHYAARAGHFPTVKRLLELGADATVFASDKQSPFDVVRDEKVRKLMIQKSFLDPAYYIFKTFDANDGGSIDTAELSWVLKSVLPDMTQADLEAVFKDCDLDDNGEIDFQELVQWLWNGSGRTMVPEILAAAESIADSGEALPTDLLDMAEQAKPKKKAHKVDRIVLSEDIYRDSEGYQYLTDFVDKPPLQLNTVQEHIKDLLLDSSSSSKDGLRQSFESLLRFPDVLEEVEHIYRLKCTTMAAHEMNNDGMLYAVIFYTFDLSLLSQQEVYPAEANFQFICNKMIRERDSEMLSIGHGFLYYLMTGISRLPATTGIVYQVIPADKAEEARELLQPKTIHYWSTLTNAEKLFRNMARYSEDLVLQITLLPKNARHPSKSREISEASAVSGTSEVLLLPNIRLKVDRESTKSDIAVLELTELTEDYNLTLRAEDFDDFYRKPSLT